MRCKVARSAVSDTVAEASRRRHRSVTSARLTRLGERVQLARVPRELLPLRLDDVRRRVRDEALVREHRFRPSNLALEPLDLGGRVSVRAGTVGSNNSFEDAQLVSLQRNLDAAAPK